MTPADLPDRFAGVAYAEGTTARRLAQIGALVVGHADTLTVTPPRMGLWPKVRKVSAVVALALMVTAGT